MGHRKFAASVAAVALTIFVGGISSATPGTSDTQSVTFDLTTTRSLTVTTANVSGLSLGVNDAVGATGSGSIGYSTDATGDQVVGKITTACPTGVTLAVAATTTDGTSAGSTTLSSTDQAVITGITNVVAGTASMGYTVTASGATAGTSQSCTVTYTIEAGI